MDERRDDPAANNTGSTSEDAQTFKLNEEQSTRAFLRRRFLESLVAMGNQRVEFTMHGQTKVVAKFGTSDIDILHFQVSQLETPIGMQPEALLRCSDIISYKFEVNKRQ
ncbi:gem-associated protein 7-like [Glandiceps talaboti]